MKLAHLALAGLLLAAPLGACQTAQVETAHQTSEKALIAADELYIAIATFSNAQEANGSWTRDKAFGVKSQAYSALLIARGAYNAGNTVSTSLLTQIATQNGVTGAN